MLNQRKIRELRERAGLLRSELGEAAGVSKAFVCQIENGQRIPNVVIMAAIARKLGVKVDDLLTGDD